jgi:DNA modification methylase
MEISPQYVDVAVRRWQQFTGQQAIHAETGKTFTEVASGNEAKN